uniref:Putative secreted protein n=1 Tax=Ixodes ricinus TaxID=34613 RepID=A0A6B0US45_IXORI
MSAIGRLLLVVGIVRGVLPYASFVLPLAVVVDEVAEDKGWGHVEYLVLGPSDDVGKAMLQQAGEGSLFVGRQSVCHDAPQLDQVTKVQAHGSDVVIGAPRGSDFQQYSKVQDWRANAVRVRPRKRNRASCVTGHR